MLAVERTELAPHIAKAALAALVLTVVLELVAVFGYRQDTSARLDFGFSENTGFAVSGGMVHLRPVASRGLWRQNYPVPKPAGVKRIVAVGDSVLRGGSYGESVAGQLSGLLAACGARAEVWNLASPGYGSQRKDIMVKKALEFEPDLVVYHANVTTEYEDAREWERRERHASWHPSQWPEKLPLLGRISMSMTEKIYWRWLDPEVRAGFDREGMDLDEALRSKADVEHWMPIMLDNFARTRARLRAAHVPLIVVVRGDLLDDGPEMTDHGLEAEIGTLAKAEGFRWVATRAVARQGDARAFFADGSHWTASGHERMARALLPVVQKTLSLRCR
jgi:hypothetical protein